MIKNKRALSGVITTLIIILLVIAAIGIVWFVVRPFISGGGETFNIGTKCLQTEVEVTAVMCGTNDLCNVTLRRGSDGADELGGVNLIFYNSAGTDNYIKKAEGDIGQQELETVTDIDISDLSGTPETLSIASYFIDSSGSESACDETGSYTIAIA